MTYENLKIVNFLCSQQFFLTCEPPHDKTNKVACAPREDSDQPGHPPSLISLRWLGSLATHRAHSKNSAQTGQKPRLI